MISFIKCEKEVSPMQLVIYIFIALCTLAIAILFTEVTGKLFKALLALVGACFYWLLNCFSRTYDCKVY